MAIGKIEVCTAVRYNDRFVLNAKRLECCTYVCLCTELPCIGEGDEC